MCLLINEGFVLSTIQTIFMCSNPGSAAQVRQFLAVGCFFSCLMSGSASRRSLLKAELEWSDPQQPPFNRLKVVMGKMLILNSFIKTKS